MVSSLSAMSFVYDFYSQQYPFIICITYTGAGYTSRRSDTATPELKWTSTYKNDVKALFTIFNGTDKDISDLLPIRK